MFGRRELLKRRVPEVTKGKLAILNDIDPDPEDPGMLHSAISHYVELVENYFKTEVGRPVEFDSKTGEPTEWEWTKEERFEQVGSRLLSIDGAQYTDPSSTSGGNVRELPVFSERMVDYIKNTLMDELPLAIDIMGGLYCIQEAKIAWSYGPRRHGTRSGIEVVPVRRLTLQGIVDY